MITWQQRALELTRAGMRPYEVRNRLESEGYGSFTYDKVQCYIKRHKNDSPEVTPASQRVVLENREPTHHSTKWDGTETIRFGLVSDTHLGSKYDQLTYLHEFYDLCEQEGITDIYHAGDVTDGLKMRTGHEFEVYTVAADEMVDNVIKNYPCRKNITTYFITGNHDASIYKHVGYDVGHAIARGRPDMVYLGRDCAVINLTPECTLELRHPWDGGAYSLSYRIQKMIEAMEADSKPNILVVGHYHKSLYMFYRNIHALYPGCFQSQTPFTRGKCISTQMGGYIVEVKVDKDGTIQAFKSQFVPFYKPAKDDYKKWKK